MVHHRDKRADFGVIGFGRFGRFAAVHLRRRGRVLAWDASWQGIPAELPGFVQAAGLPAVCAARVVILCVPIRAMRGVLQEIRPLLRPPTLVADTASVKVWPSRWLTELLPPDLEILATHPLFGPDSADSGLRGHSIALVPVRLRHPRLVRGFLQSLGLEIHETTAEAHDRAMAETQNLVHWLGRALDLYGAKPGPLDTRGYRQLLEIRRHVSRDTWELYQDLQQFNPYGTEARSRFVEALRRAGQQEEPEGGPRAPHV